jgi:integrase
MRVLSPDDVRELLQTATEDRYEALYVLAVSTGLRQGELLALRWQDIDLEARTLQVRQTLHRTRGEYVFSQPKTAKSRRLVILATAAVSALRRRRVLQAEDRLQIGAIWQDYDLVFTNEIGGPIDAGNLRTRSFQHLLQRAGLPRVRFHDLRHTAATLMLGRGIHPKVVSEMLGHSQIAITLDLYSHVTPTMQREAAQAMDELLGAGGRA